MSHLLQLKEVETVGGHRPVTLGVDVGDNIVLRGPSGCGKTSLLRVISGIDECRTGSVVRNFGACGFAFQETRLLPRLTIRENLEILPQAAGAGFDAKLGRTLESLGLNELADRSAGILSGGEQQRVNIGRAILCEPELLLLDEAASNLDDAAFAKVRALILTQMADRNMSLIQVSHLPTRLVGEAQEVSVA